MTRIGQPCGAERPSPDIEEGGRLRTAASSHCEPFDSITFVRGEARLFALTGTLPSVRSL